MAILRQNNQKNVQMIAKAASTAIAVDEILTISAAGFVTPAVAASANLIGLSMERVASTDTDFAGTRKIQIDVPTGAQPFILDTTGGAVAQTMVGEFFDLSNSTTLNVGVAATVKHFKVLDILGTGSGARVLVAFNPNIVLNA